MLKKSFWIRSLCVSLALSFSLTLAACDSASQENPSSGTAGKEQVAENADPITLQYSFWGDDYTVQQKIKAAELYTVEHPNVSFEYIYCSGVDYQTKMQTWFSSGDAPDIISTAVDIMVPYLDTGSFEDLSDRVKNDGLEKAWMPELVEFFTHDGKLLSAPNQYVTTVLAYNKDLFDQAGVEYPKDDWTEEEFYNTLESLKNGLSDPETYAIHMPYAYPLIFYRRLYGDPGMYDLQTMQMTSKDNPRFQKAFENMARLTIDGYMPYTTASRSAVQGGFETGKYALGLITYGNLPTMRDQVADSFEWDTVMWPYSEEFETRWTAVVFGNGYGIYTGNEHKDQAWDVIKFLTTTPEVCDIDAEFGVPALQTYQNDSGFMEDYLGCDPFNKQVFVNTLESATIYYSVGVWAQVNDVAVDQFNQCIEGKTDFDSAIEVISQQGQEIFDANRMG